MRKPQAFLTVIILVAAVGIIIFQQQTISRLRLELAESRTALKQLKLGAENSERPSEGKNEQSKVAHSEHAELLRLRGEVTRLKGTAMINAQTDPSPTIVQQRSTVVSSEAFTVATNYTVRLKNKETTVTGGWELTPGKKTFVFVTPEFDERKQIMLSSRFFAIPNANLEALKEQMASGKFGEADYKVFVEHLEAMGEVDRKGAPRVITANGQTAQVALLEDLIIDGKETQYGPILGFTPVIAPDGMSVSVTVHAVVTNSPKLR